MQSNNPVFNRAEGFNGRGGTQTANDPSQWRIDLSGPQNGGHAPTSVDDRMTMDSVVEKTAITLGLVIAAAAVTWFLIGDMAANQNRVALASGLAVGGALLGFGLVLLNGFKKVVSPPLVLAYAVVEGVFIGAFSKLIVNFVVPGQTEIVFQAVLATMVTFGATLAVYKFFNIQVNDKFRRIVTIATISVAGVLLVNFLLSITGVFDQGGLRGFNTTGLIVSFLLIGLAIFNLILDFDFAERGIEAGLPARESWTAALGLTVTLVWLYIEFVRVFAILNQD